MTAILIDTLMGMAVALIPLLTTFFVAWIKNKTANLKSDLAEKYINEVAVAVADAVTATSQTYVDTLKQNGSFNKDAHKVALEKALMACTESLSPKCFKFLETMYGDVELYLTNKIEAEVRNQKEC